MSASVAAKPSVQRLPRLQDALDLRFGILEIAGPQMLADEDVAPNAIRERQRHRTSQRRRCANDLFQQWNGGGRELLVGQRGKPAA